MSERILTLPRMGETMEEGTVLVWNKKEGEDFLRGDILLELETDKMVVEVPALEDGTLLEILAVEGSKIRIGAPIAKVEGELPESAKLEELREESLPASEYGQLEDEEMENIFLTASPLDENPLPDKAYDGPEAWASGPEENNLQMFFDEAAGFNDSDGPVEDGESASSGIRASPAARRLAARYGLELKEIRGTGPLGRVIKEDVEQVLNTLETGEPDTGNVNLMPKEGSSQISFSSADAGMAFLRKGPTGKTPLVLIHGFGGDLHSWRFNFSMLAKHREVWALDLPGHGNSRFLSLPPDSTSSVIEQLTEAVGEFLMTRGLDRLHLTGHSLGGAVSLCLAAAFPERVASLALLAPLGMGPGINIDFIESFISARDPVQLSAVLQRLFYRGSWVNAALIGPLEKQRQVPEHMQTLKELSQGLTSDGRQCWQGRDLLEKLDVPVKVIWGREDQVIPSEHAFGLPGTVSLHLFRETGHMVHIEQAMAVNRLIEELCASE